MRSDRGKVEAKTDGDQEYAQGKATQGGGDHLDLGVIVGFGDQQSGEQRAEAKTPVAGLLSGIRRQPLLCEGDLLARIRNDFGYNKRQLPVLVMTGDENRDNQSGLLREGANDLVLKPIEERLLVTKTLFQLRVAKLPEQRSIDA